MAKLIHGAKISRYYYQKTEQRLYNLAILKIKLQDDLEDLESAKALPELSEDRQSLEESIARDKHEVGIMDRALKLIQGDDYYDTISGKYFDRLNDLDLAEKIGCDSSTVWRHRKRLISCLAIRLYGTQALKDRSQKE